MGKAILSLIGEPRDVGDDCHCLLARCSYPGSDIRRIMTGWRCGKVASLHDSSERLSHKDQISSSFWLLVHCSSVSVAFGLLGRFGHFRNDVPSLFLSAGKRRCLPGTGSFGEPV